MSYTVDALIAKVKLWSSMPDDQPAFTDEQLADIMNDEMIFNVVPKIMNNMEEYFVKYTDFTISTSESFLIPSRAIGGILREVKLINPNDADDIVNIPRVDSAQIESITDGFYVQGNYLILKNYADYTSYNLRMYFYRRPNTLLIATDSTYGSGTITAINTGTNTVTAAPSAVWTNSTRVDLIQANPPFDVLAENQAVTVGGGNIVFSSLPSNLAVGDYVAYTGYSPIPNIPAESLGLLTQSTIIKVLESLGDEQGRRAAVDKYKQYEENIKNILSPRVHGEVKKIVKRNGFI